MIRKISARWWGLLGLICWVGFFWFLVFQNTTVTTPRYHGQEYEVLNQTRLGNMWQWKDYGEGRFRFSPFGLILIHKIENKILTSFLPAENFADPASRPHMKAVYVLFFLLLAAVVYLLAFDFIKNIGGAFLAGAYLGANKSLFGFFWFMSTFAALFLVLFASLNLFFTRRLLLGQKGWITAGFYASFFLCIGTWEHWLNLVPVYFLMGLWIWRKERLFDRRAFHLMIAPAIFALIYVAIRIPLTVSETGQVGEAQFVFKYPSVVLMIEDMVSNMSYHWLNVVESLLIPWPTLSQSMTLNFNMNQFNAYNALYSKVPSVHYQGFKLWYAGLMTGLLAWFSVWFWKLRRQTQYSKSLDMGWIGYMLFIFGFAVHIPIMHRTYFLTPGFFIGYKQMISILGFSLLIGWLYSQRHEIFPRFPRWNLVPLILIWMFFANYLTIVANPNAGFPW